MKVPQLSVIVPVYNAEKTLRQCVDSILSQTYEDFELLLIDDGSKDSSPIICNEYEKKDSRVRVFYKENGGVSSARNLGLEFARGEWITFIDSDDYITIGFFDGLIGVKEDIIFRGYAKFNHNGIIDVRKPSDFLQKRNLTSFINTYYNDTILRGPVSKFYRHNLLNGLQFHTDMKIGEDACFLFSYLSKCKSFFALEKGRYMIRMNDDPYEKRYSMSVEYAATSLLHLKDAFEELMDTYKIDPSVFFSYIAFLKLMSKGEWKHNPKLWYNNPVIMELYHDILPSVSLIQKCRFILSKLHSYIKSYE